MPLLQPEPLALDELTAFDDEERELDIATDEETAELAGVDDIVVPQAAPLITGISAGALPLVPWKPNSTDWFGCKLPFQLILVAV